jgi:hypothetical protein
LIFRRLFRITACNGQKEARLTNDYQTPGKELRLFHAPGQRISSGETSCHSPGNSGWLAKA